MKIDQQALKFSRYLKLLEELHFKNENILSNMKKNSMEVMSKKCNDQKV